MPDAFFKNTVSKDFFRLVCGSEIGSGVGRKVYACTLRDDLVIKFETDACSFQNITEWQIWNESLYNDRIAKWIAPCEFISPCGTILAMKRTKNPSISQYPTKLPVFLTDTKSSNYGLLRGKFVCHDYGTANLITSGNAFQMRKVKWW